MTFYIQRKDANQLETVDEFATRKEAKAMLAEYQLADRTAEHYISTRACSDWESAKTPVKFVVFQGEIVALFPKDRATDHSKDIMSYAHIGQHSAACASLLKCKRATPYEYKSLAEELTNHCGYTLEIV